MTECATSATEGGNTNPPPKEKVIQGKRWCFTLNNYTDDECATVRHEFEQRQALFVLGREVGEKGTPHIQGYVEFKSNTRFTTLKRICDRVHWEKARGDRESNVKYCCKDENFESNIPLPRRERLLKRLYDNVEWRPWQQRVIDLVKNDTYDDRCIYWFWEPDGCVGKSFLTKYIYLKYGCLICSGKAQDIFYQVKTFLDENEEIDDLIVVCDIPRSLTGYVSYVAIEKLKDGLINSGKYEGGTVPWATSKIFCFSNSLPNLDGVSRDRWVVERLGEGVDNESEITFDEPEDTIDREELLNSL